MMNLRDRQGLDQVERDMRFYCETVGRRLAGSPGEEQATDYTLERFSEMGLVRTEKLPFNCNCWTPGEARLDILGPAGTTATAALEAQQVTHTPSPPDTGLEGELVVFEPIDWHHGLRTSEALSGKIGLFLGGYGESEKVFAELHNSELAALLFVDTRLQTAWPIANGVGERFARLVRKPMAYLSLIDAFGLVRDGVRRVRLHASGTTQEATSWNAVGELPGSDPGGQVIVVAGHLDSVSVGVGADDNASGMAAVLECARRLRERDLRHTVRFIGFGAEEQLSVGSSRYVNEQAGDLDRVGFVCNFDGIAAHLGITTVMCTGTPEFDRYVSDTVDRKLQFGETVSDACPYQDQFWFTTLGIPGVWITRKTDLNHYWYHHSVHNDLGVISMEQLAWAAEAGCEIMDGLVNSTDWPFPRALAPELKKKTDKYLADLF